MRWRKLLPLFLGIFINGLHLTTFELLIDSTSSIDLWREIKGFKLLYFFLSFISFFYIKVKEKIDKEKDTTSFHRDTNDLLKKCTFRTPGKFYEIGKRKLSQSQFVLIQLTQTTVESPQTVKYNHLRETCQTVSLF